MDKQIFNPYLPLGTYIPDGEPHVFGNRLYIFGSHDSEGGQSFCTLPYECWSAPLSDLSDFRCDGVMYRPEQDPMYSEKMDRLFAPDVVQGNDGNYYLYYAMSGSGQFTGPIHVARADRPEGPYAYYGEVREKDGSTFDRYITFDPGLLNDDGRIYLYYGWSLDTDQDPAAVQREDLLRAEEMLFQKTRDHITQEPYPYMGANVVELEEDMLTVKGAPKRIVPGQFDAMGTPFEGHAFFEASSMRKIGSIYYFIYSSEVQHELCYATSRYPDRDFVFGGVIISNGDIGMDGRRMGDAAYITGNNHGSLCRLGDDWYIFYHRHTHKTSFSRQGCAERVEILPDGSIPQVRITSCGLNHGPLHAQGTYPAVICCILTNGHLPHQTTEPIRESMPHIDHEGSERFVSEITDGTRIGYRSFFFDGPCFLALTYEGEGEGAFLVETEERAFGEIPVTGNRQWTRAGLVLSTEGTHTLLLTYHGSGSMRLRDIAFEKI